MNYIKLINAFWEMKRSRADFDPYVVSLYFAILHLANKHSWQPFSMYREDIIGIAEMSHNSYYKARKVLKDSGLINFNEGSNKVSKCTFTVLLVSLSGTQRSTQQGHDVIHDKDTTGTQRNTILDKPINLKTNKPINKENKENKENAETSSADPLNNSENFESKIISLPAEKEKRKKVAQKKESDPYTAAMKIIYVRKFPDVYYAAKEATNMKQLSEKLFMGFKMKHDNRMPTVEEIEESFQYLMDNLPQWMLDKGFITPSDINSQFEKVKAELLNQKKNGRQPNYDFNELIAEVERTTGSKLSYASNSH